jgi:hypothetical protein
MQNLDLKKEMDMKIEGALFGKRKKTSGRMEGR